MPALFGPVLTNTRDAASFIEHYRAGKFSAAKVITGWGLDSGWDLRSRAAVVAMTPRLMVRSVTGDPSYRRGTTFLDPDQAVEEFRPWVRLRPDIWLELGNEPDVAGSEESTIWVYRYWLGKTIERLRREFPRARLVAPAMRINHDPRWPRWYEVMHDVMNECDSIGMHFYGFHRVFAPKGEDSDQLVYALQTAVRYFARKSIAVTEFGIHDPQMPAAAKLAQYRDFAQRAPARVTWALYYHICDRRDIQPEYHVTG